MRKLLKLLIKMSYFEKLCFILKSPKPSDLGLSTRAHVLYYGIVWADSVSIYLRY